MQFLHIVSGSRTFVSTYFMHHFSIFTWGGCQEERLKSGTKVCMHCGGGELDFTKKEKLKKTDVLILR